MYNNNPSIKKSLTKHRSVRTIQDWTPKFTGHIQPDRTKSGFILILHN